jgi:phosphatidate cytidylyltransferase
MLKQRILTALVLVALLVWALFAWPQTAFAAFLGFFILVGAWEWTALCGLKKLPARLSYVALVMAAGVFLIVTPPAILPLMAIAVLWWLWSFIELVSYSDVRRGLLASRTGKLLSGFVLLLPAWLAPLVLRAQSPQGEWLTLFLLFIVFSADTGAYFAGHRWGKTKLAPSISPGKTWEGVAGGLAAVLVLALAAGVYGAHYSGSMLAAWVALALGTGFVSVLGDLFESRAKRAAGVKDSGVLFPGHGGVLDRIDAFTAAAPLFTLVWLCWQGPAGAR